MSEGPDLTFDADGFVRMDALPDVDPDAAVTPDELARLQAALHDESVPSRVGADWDAMVADVDRIDFGDSIDLVPDDGTDTDVASGPIVLVEDQIDAARRPADFEPDAVGRTNPASAGADPSAATAELTSTDDPLDPSLETGSLDEANSAWVTADPYAIPGDAELAPDLGELDTIDDLLDVDVVELHPDNGDLPGTPH